MACQLTFLERARISQMHDAGVTREKIAAVKYCAEPSTLGSNPLRENDSTTALRPTFLSSLLQLRVESAYMINEIKVALKKAWTYAPYRHCAAVGVGRSTLLSFAPGTVLTRQGLPSMDSSLVPAIWFST